MHLMRRRNIILIGIAAGLLIAGILVLTLLPQSGPETDINAHVPPQSGTDTGNLINATYVNADSVVMMPLNRNSYTLQIDRSETEYLKFDLISEDSIFPGMQTVMYAIFSQAAELMHLPKVTENADDNQLALYGFNEPVLTWRVNLSDGTSAEFALGVNLAVGTGNYVRATDSRDIYVLDSAAVRLLLMDVEDIYDIYFFPFPPSGDQYETWDLIDHLLLERPGHDTIELRRRSFDEWADLPLGHTRYIISQPFDGEGNEQVIRNIIMEPVTNLIPEQIILVKAPDLSVFGLDRPARLTVTVEGWEGTLLIGQRSNEHRGRYVMIEGYDAVLLDPNGNYSFLDIDPGQLRSQMSWVHHIDDVSSVIFILDGITRVLNIEHPASEDDDLNGRLDDVEIGESNTRRLYASAMSIPSSGNTTASIPNEAPAYSMKMNFTAGGSQTIEFFSISESEYLMVLDGSSLGIYTTRLQIQLNLLNQFETLDTGGELPMR